jgi:predicted transcriptional regulator
MDTAVRKTDARARDGLLNAFDLILKGRGRSDTPGKSLKCIGLYTVILRLRALDKTVTRQTLARETGLTENAIAPHVRYLESLGLVKMTLARARNSIAREFHIDAEDALIVYTRKAIARDSCRAYARDESL